VNGLIVAKPHIIVACRDLFPVCDSIGSLRYCRESCFDGLGSYEGIASNKKTQGTAGLKTIQLNYSQDLFEPRKLLAGKLKAKPA
jgi:hypothetical protein